MAAGQISRAAGRGMARQRRGKRRRQPVLAGRSQATTGCGRGTTVRARRGSGASAAVISLREYCARPREVEPQLDCRKSVPPQPKKRREQRPRGPKAVGPAGQASESGARDRLRSVSRAQSLLGMQRLCKAPVGTSMSGEHGAVGTRLAAAQRSARGTSVGQSGAWRGLRKPTGRGGGERARGRAFAFIWSAGAQDR
jgi:hypothetical protein